MAGGMISDGAIETRADIFDFHYIDEELRKLIDPRTQRRRAFRQFRLIGEQIGIENPDHARTRARGNHYRRAWLAGAQEFPGQIERRLAQPFIERRLSATE